MNIIHVSGTMCSGKTYTIIPFLDQPGVAFWDVLNLYKREGCLVNGLMVWDRWEEVKGTIIPDLKEFLERNKDKKICFIESGTNQTIAKFLSNIETIDIQLQTPDKKTITERAIKRNLKTKQVLNFRDMFLKRHVHNDINQYTQEEAFIIISAFVNLEPVKAMLFKHLIDKNKQPKEELS